MQSLPITLNVVRTIQARAYNNVRLIKLADRIRRFDLDAKVSGDCVQVIYRHDNTIKIFSVTKFDQLYDQLPCQYCHDAKPTGHTGCSLVCNECYCEHHGPCGEDSCKLCNSVERFEQIHGFKPTCEQDMLLFRMGM